MSKASGKASVPRKHHYIPQSLLRGFCCPGKGEKIWVLPKNQELAQKPQKPFQSSVGKVACEIDFHSVEREGAGMDHSSIESMLSKVEDHQARWIKKVLVSGLAGQIDRIEAAALMSTYRCRVPAFKEHVRRGHEAVIRNIADHVIGKGIVPFPDGMPEEIKERIRREKSDLFRVNISNNELIRMMMSIAFDEETIISFSRMGYSIGVVGDKSESLVISDYPVTVSAIGAPGDISAAIGPGSPFVELCMPITRKACLIAQWRDLPLTVTLSSADVSEINRRSCILATRYIFSPDGSAGMVEMVEATKDQRAGLQLETLPAPDGTYFLNYMSPLRPDRKIIR